MKTIFLECNMGAAGDMLLGALYEICEEKEQFLHQMNEVLSPLGITVSADSTVKCGIRGTQISISCSSKEIPDSTAVPTQIQSLALPDVVKKDTAAIYHLMQEAVKKIHPAATGETVSFDENTFVTLAHITGCALLIHLIAPKQILAAPVHVGNGFVQCADGILPVPTPVVAEILKGIPYYTGSITSELCTPAGAAILKYYVSRFSPMPSLATSAIGYGMGQKDFEIINCVRAFLGETAPQQTVSSDDDEFLADDAVLAVSCNIDDMTGEALGLATEILMAAGALDVYTIPVQMKKNRPGILLTCICEPKDREKFTGLFFLHTSTHDVRYQVYERAKLESTFETRTSAYGDIRIKRSSGYGIEKEKPAFEDLKSLVLKNGCSFSLDEVTKSIASPRWSGGAE